MTCSDKGTWAHSSKRNASDQRIVEPGQQGGGTNSDEAREKARRSGMTKGTACGDKSSSEYEQCIAWKNK